MIDLQAPKANAAAVRLGALTLYFSYALCIGYRRDDGEQLVNPKALGVSTTTAKHLSGFGLKGAAVAASAEEFEAGLLGELRTV